MRPKAESFFWGGDVNMGKSNPLSQTGKGICLPFLLFNNNSEAVNGIFFPSLSSQSHLFPFSHKNFHPIYSFSDRQGKDENGLVMGVAIKLIITELATVNTIMDYLFK